MIHPTESICLEQVKRDGMVLECVPEALKTESVCTTALHNDGRAVQFLPEQLRTEAMYLIGVRRNCDALRLVPMCHQTQALRNAAAPRRNVWPQLMRPRPKRPTATKCG